MALSVCTPVLTDSHGRELIEHGTALFPVACYNDDLSAFEVAWHWHEELEVFIVEAGTARVLTNGSSDIVNQGEGVFINSGVLHGVWQAGETPCRLRSVVFHPRLVGGSMDSVIWQKYLEPLLGDSSRPYIRFSDDRTPEKAALECIARAWQCCAEEEAGFELDVRECLSRIIFLLSRNFPSAEKRPSKKALRDGERTKAMLRYIQAHADEEISLEQVAQSANISKNECLRCFRSVIGCTPIQYVRQIRIQKAAELLQSTAWKIADIGMMCGFQEMSYFAKTFKAFKGCTPHEFRERHSPEGAAAKKKQ